MTPATSPKRPRMRFPSGLKSSVVSEVWSKVASAVARKELDRISRKTYRLRIFMEEARSQAEGLRYMVVPCEALIPF